MITTLILAVACVIFAGVIAANCLLNNTRWHLCPRCWHWHNEIGERSDKAPIYGQLRSESCVCKVCARYRNLEDAR